MNEVQLYKDDVVASIIEEVIEYLTDNDLELLDEMNYFLFEAGELGEESKKSTVMKNNTIYGMLDDARREYECGSEPELCMSDIWKTICEVAIECGIEVCGTAKNALPSELYIDHE